ncbi:glycoside hydrolase family 30 protein [Anaerosporobacter sp.]|uniref:glycoside hydrolase family 30 protein n=1 Tax=Anaerosporobacter sp. TaxID=1872529 RepID=UPI00286F0A7A|nr:glycoside hydrolase family 30 beta sandwich domain-containing protein [Anaerosporobacter sp.]
MNIKCYRSNEEKQFEVSELSFIGDEKAEMNLIKVYPNETRQTVLGFGGAFTEAAAETMSTMSDKTKEQFLQAYFGEEGNKYNFCRTHIQSCDFSLGNYAYVEDAEDKELKTFTLERDKQYLVPMIQDALAINPDIQLLASPWSPPAFMKTNNEMNHGGVLKKEFYPMWADMIVKYVEEYEKLGIKIHRISVQNEPKATQTWDSCLYTGEEEGIFATEYLRKALDAHEYSNIVIVIWDHNKDCILERADETFSVVGAKDSVGAIGFHWYTGDHFEALDAVRMKYPEKELIFTEGCVEYSRFKSNNQVKNAEMYLHDIIGNLNQGMNGYIDWNLVLNAEGGPNHVGNFCDAPVMYDKDSDQLDIKLSYYYIGHLSRYVKKGAKRILVSRHTDQVDAVGFVNPDGEKIVVLMNRTAEDLKMQICESRSVCDITLTAHSVITLCW